MATSTESVLIWAAVSSKAQDKYSIEDQLRMSREWCARTGALIIDELVVRGFSRDYWTLADVVAAAADDPDMTAFARLQDHIKRRSFTLFLCLDADRFGRTTSLVHEVIGRITRDCGAQIYTMLDGMWINAENATMVGTMKAFKAQTDIDKLREYRRVGMLNRAQNGKSTSGIMPMFHKRIRDNSGKEIGVVVNEDLRSLWTDLVEVVLRGVQWHRVEQVLFEEFHHARTNGTPYIPLTMRQNILHPAFWGHAALNYRFYQGRYVHTTEPWVWDETVDPPPEVTIFRNRLPAVYGGQWKELGEQLKGELWRRYGLRGKAASYGTFRFSGLLICAECRFTLQKVNTGNEARVYMRCQTQWVKRRDGTRCTQTQVVRVEYIQAWFHSRLEARIAKQATTLFEELDHSEDIERQLNDATKQHERLQQRAGALIIELADAPDNVREVYRRKIAETSSEIERLDSSIRALRDRLGSTLEARTAQESGIKLLREHGVAWLWDQPSTFIHQFLSSILGEKRLEARDGKIVGFTTVRRFRYPKNK